MASADTVRKQAGQPRTDGHIDVTVEERKHGKRGIKGDSTLTNIGPMDRYVAVEAPSHRVREKGVKKKKDEAQGPIISAANPRQ
jgi:hypothetical protein